MVELYKLISDFVRGNMIKFNLKGCKTNGIVKYNKHINVLYEDQ